MSDIHPSAIVDPAAHIAGNVRIGPGAVVGAGVSLGEGCELGAHTVIEGSSRIGPGCRIFHGAVIGTEGQHTNIEGAEGGVEIGALTSETYTGKDVGEVFPALSKVVSRRLEKFGRAV